MRAEKVADLPVPTRYVNDFAGMLSPTAQQQLEDLCAEVHNQANADIEVVTIKSLEDQSIEEFTAALEEKWKIGKKGVDRSALVVMVFNPRKLRVETGYGLEGFLPDAKVGRILDTAIPSAKDGGLRPGDAEDGAGAGGRVAAGCARDADARLCTAIIGSRRLRRRDSARGR